MVTGIEGVGEAVTGGMIARAVEPGSGEADDEGHTHEKNCLNCGALLTGPYCSACGQKSHIHRTLTAFFHDLVHGVLHVEGKIWRTLPMLAFRPGQLTRRYIDGERARFVSPMALFLFSVFLMFAVFSTVGGPVTMEANPATTDMMSDFERETIALLERRTALEQQRRSFAQRRLPTAALDAQLAEIRTETAALDAMTRVVAPTAGQPKASERDTRRERRRVRGAPGLVLNENNVDTGWPRLDQAILKASDNPTLFMYKVQTNAYKFSWALIPISVPFVWLMFFWRRRFRVYDHTVFVTYSLAFMTLLTVLLSLLLPIVRTDVVAGFALVFIPPIHMYKQLKGAYELGRFRALVRTILLVWFAFISATLFFLLLLTLGALG